MYWKKFYNENLSSSDSSAEELVKFIFNLFVPNNTIDIGCSTGLFLNKFLERGVEDVVGIDGPWVPLNLLAIPRGKFKIHNLTKPIIIERKFDLALCLEVAEHLPKDSAETLINTLTGFSDKILFSAAIPGQGGTHHLNEQWPTYWITKFSKRGYVFIDLRPYIWSNPKILPWYKQNLFLFIRPNYLNEYLEKLKTINFCDFTNIVHPEIFESICYLNKRSLYRLVRSVAVYGKRLFVALITQ